MLPALESGNNFLCKFLTELTLTISARQQSFVAPHVCPEIPTYSSRTKHITLRIPSHIQLIKSARITIDYVDTHVMLADTTISPLTNNAFTSIIQRNKKFSRRKGVFFRLEKGLHVPLKAHERTLLIALGYLNVVAWGHEYEPPEHH